MQEPPRGEVAALYVTFFWSGIATVLLGPLLPELARRFTLSAGQLAFFFPAQFAGSALGSILAGRFPRRGLLAGYPAMAIGMLLLSQGNVVGTAAAFFIVGLGIGLVSTSTNLRMARGTPERRGARLAAINFVWGLGASASPLLYSICRRSLGFETSLYLLALLLFACLGVLLLAGLAARRETAPSPASVMANAATADVAPANAATAGAAGAAAGFRQLLPFVLLFFLYVGVENAWGGWLVELADHQNGNLDAYWVGTLYWSALLFGRGVAPFLLRHVSERLWMRVSLATAALGGLGIALAPARAQLAIGAGLAGLGLAALFPLSISLLTAATTARGGKEAGWVFSFTGAGGASLPWLVGACAELSGNLQLALVVPLLALAGFGAALPRAEARARGDGRILSSNV